jgi:hypothetical protein
MMVGVPQDFDTGLFENPTNVNVVVDTIIQKAYCHHPLNSQEQPLYTRISSDLF